MNKRVLVAGYGDVGRRLGCLLAARGDTVFGLRRTAQPDADGVRMLAADLGDPGSLRGLPGGITHVAYLPTPGARQPEAYRRVFVEGLGHLLDALDRTALRRLLFVSSTAVYGDHGGHAVDEGTPPAPPGFNGAILLEGERLAAAAGVESVVLRLTGLYGPGRTQLFERLRAGRARAPRTPPFWAHRIHVDDAAAAIAHLLELPEPAPLYLGSDGTPLPLYELYVHIARRLGAPAPGDGPPPPGIGNKRIDGARLRASGFRPAWPDAREGYDALIEAESRPARG